MGCVVALSQGTAATGDAKTGDAANAVVPTMCQRKKLVDMPYINKASLVNQGLLVQMTLEREYGEGEKKVFWLTSDARKCDICRNPSG